MKFFTKMVLVFLVSMGSLSAAVDTSFTFGIWTQLLPAYQDSLSNAFFLELHDDLHCNAVVGQLYNSLYLEKYRSAHLNVFVQNDAADPTGDGVHISGVHITDSPVWPRIYGESIYRTWESEGGGVDACNLVFRGGADVQSGLTTYSGKDL